MIGLLSENAQIRTPNNINVCIECLDPGDIILSAVVPKTTVPAIQVVESTVIGVTKMICDHFNIINNRLIANDYQSLLVNNEWYPFNELLTGMSSQIIGDDGDHKIVDEEIRELDKFDKQLENIMYTLILYPHNTFFADGYIVKGVPQ